jgi:plastocyanin
MRRLRTLLGCLLSAASALALGVAYAQSGAVVDECSAELYLDRTTQGADRTFHWDYSFAGDPERCITVRVGQSVTWQGNFGDHPLAADEGDQPNPIANHVDGLVTFTTPGTFGYRCNYHFEMRGAIRVLPAATPVPWAPPLLQSALLALFLGGSFFAARHYRTQATTPDALERRAVARVWLARTLLLVVAAALAHTLGPGRYGSPDSATYLSAAQHMANGDGYVTSGLDEHGHFAQLSLFAPLFSVLVASAITLTGTSALSALSDLLVASYMLYALACDALMRVLLVGATRRWAGLFALCLICAPGSVSCVRGALSDLLGAALVLFACSHVLATNGATPFALTRGQLARSALVSGLLFALALYARWSNLYFALSAVLGLVICLRTLPLRERVTRALLLAGAVVLLVGPLWLHNVRVTGALMGQRPAHASNPLFHVRQACAGIAEAWFGSALSTRSALALLYLACLLVSAAGLAGCWLVRRDFRLKLGLCLAFGYAALLVVSRSTTSFDQLDHPRFWLPFVPLLLGLSLRASDALAPRTKRRALATGSLLVLAIAPLGSALKLARESGPIVPYSGLFARRFASSEAVQRALALTDAGRCTLWAPHAFWLYPQIGTRPIGWLSEDGSTRSLSALPSCVVLLREPVAYNTDSALFQRRLRGLTFSAHARLLTRDPVAELWWTDRASGSALASNVEAHDSTREHNHAHHVH